MNIDAIKAAKEFIDSFLPGENSDLYGKIDIIFNMLESYNAHTNLTRIASFDEFWIKHVADSLAIFKFFPELRESDLRLLDVGCGAGFPSLMLALAAPRLQIDAVDSIGKKIAFVDSVREELKLSNLNCFAARTKELNCQEQWQHKYDIITARAVSDARTLYRENKNLLKLNGKFIFYKSPEQLVSDLPQVTAASAKAGLKWNCSAEFELPEAGGTREFLYSSN